MKKICLNKGGKMEFFAVQIPVFHESINNGLKNQAWHLETENNGLPDSYLLLMQFITNHVSFRSWSKLHFVSGLVMKP